jgi:hypothetical protein
MKTRTARLILLSTQEFFLFIRLRCLFPVTENLEEMLRQYRGREVELFATLRTMQERGNMHGEDETRSLFNVSQIGSTASVFENDGEDSTIASYATGVRRSSIGSASSGSK